MLYSILKDQYSSRNKGEQLRKLYESIVVSGCLFQSFNDFQKNIILRFISNQCRLSDKQLQKQLNPSDPTIIQQLKQTFQKFQQLSIIEYIRQQSIYRMSRSFSNSLQKYIINPYKYKGQELPQGYINQMEEFDLLRLLYEGNPILKECRLKKIDWKNNDDYMTKDNFDYIRATVNQKVGILIKGYLKYNKAKAHLSDILVLSLLNPSRAYKITQKNAVVVQELQSLKLLKSFAKQNQFIISTYLHHFAFSSPLQTQCIKGSLKCKIIIQTNFKVYVQVHSSPQTYQMLKSILKSLIKIQHQQYNFQQLIVGSITQQKMMSLFSKNINSQQFFNFFQQYMDHVKKQEEKDLGKWNKIKFLGLQGVNKDTMIPNNVRQEVKLWENLHKFHKSYDDQDNNIILMDSDDQPQDKRR